MTAHKHAALMLQYAKDAMETDEPWERWEWRNTYHYGDDDQWKQLSFHPVWNMDSEFRRKPETIKVGKWEFPKPIKDSPKEDEFVHYVTEGYKLSDPPFIVEDACFRRGAKIEWYLVHGLLHLSREAAEAHADVLNAICRGDDVTHWQPLPEPTEVEGD